MNIPRFTVIIINLLCLVVVREKKKSFIKEKC